MVMKKGFAFLHFEDLVSIICREFKDNLNDGRVLLLSCANIERDLRGTCFPLSGMEAAERAFPERVVQDERISAFMQNLPRQYIDRFAIHESPPFFQKKFYLINGPMLCGTQYRDWSKVTQTGKLDLSNINEVLRA